MKNITTLILALAASFAVAAPRGPMGARPMPHRSPMLRPVQPVHRGHIARPAPMPHHSSHHHGSVWGRGGRNFWPGFVGGFVGSTIASRPTIVIPPRPVFAPPPPPVVIVNPVWIEPMYELRPIYDVYGNIIEYTWVKTRDGYWR